MVFAAPAYVCVGSAVKSAVNLPRYCNKQEEESKISTIYDILSESGFIISRLPLPSSPGARLTSSSLANERSLTRRTSSMPRGGGMGALPDIKAFGTLL